MHGPCSSTGILGLHWCPHFGGALTADGRVKIRVIDDVVKTISPLRPLRRAYWRDRRDVGLARWEPAGLKFVVEEGPGEYFTDTSGWFPVVPKAIRLVRDQTERTDFAIYNSSVDGAGAAFTLDAYFYKKVNRNWAAGVVCHEIGHCLGLDHGGNGVMEGNNKPNDHDLESVRTYYLS